MSDKRKVVIVLFGGIADEKMAAAGFQTIKLLKTKGYLSEIWIVASELPHYISEVHVDTILHVKYDIFGDMMADRILPTIEKLYKVRSADLLLFLSNDFSHDMCPALAYRLHAELVTSCTNLQVSEYGILVTKPVYGGNLLAEYTLKDFPVIVTVKDVNVNPAPDLADVPAGETAETDHCEKNDTVFLEFSVLPHDLSGVKVIETKEIGEEKLENADIIFVAGRAFSNSRELLEFEELAKIAGAASGASRPLIQSGLMPVNKLIGITGISVFPKLLVAFGISGSSPFIEGIRGTKKIVALNTDTDAPIFNTATIGAVVDCKEIMKELKSQCDDH